MYLNDINMDGRHDNESQAYNRRIYYRPPQRHVVLSLCEMAVRGVGEKKTTKLVVDCDAVTEVVIF